mmetsp:Transcript_20596/g.41160  ORF Transcript_20596/g.41160 Transcript_20596/m.41160 type:complete len:223 (-) Transcript_20596:615-1283(-)
MHFCNLKGTMSASSPASFLNSSERGTTFESFSMKSRGLNSDQRSPRSSRPSFWLFVFFPANNTKQGVARYVGAPAGKSFFSTSSLLIVRGILSLSSIFWIELITGLMRKQRKQDSSKYWRTTGDSSVPASTTSLMKEPPVTCFTGFIAFTSATLSASSDLSSKNSVNSFSFMLSTASLVLMASIATRALLIPLINTTERGSPFPPVTLDTAGGRGSPGFLTA